MKGIYKGFKYITHIFVVKEEEIQIGLPTDVKHVAHIGIDGPSSSAPSWMKDFKAAPEFSSSLCSSPISESAKSTTRDSSLHPQEEDASERDVVTLDIPKTRRKQKRKKTSKSSISPKAASSSSPSHVSTSSRPRKSKLKKKKNSDDGSADQNLLSTE